LSAARAGRSPQGVDGSALLSIPRLSPPQPTGILDPLSGSVPRGRDEELVREGMVLLR
jgi:hypothetical protein